MRAKRERIGVVVASIVMSALTSVPVAARPSGGALPPELVKVVRVAGRDGVPADAALVAANVTVVGPAGPGYVTVYACDADFPATSNVNYLADQVVPNLVLSRISADGTICIATSEVTDVIVDVVGYVPAGAAVVPLEAPVRALDTRSPGGPGSPLVAGSVTELRVAGRSGIPDDASVVMFNATAIAGPDPGYLTVYPCGSRPDTSSVNHLPGQVVPNLVTSRVGDDGTVCIYNLAAADVVVDLVAYATEGIVPLATPQRVVDTRDDGAVDPAGAVLRLDITDRSDVPDDATAAVYNLTSVDATAPGYATSYPCDVTRPTVSNLNYAPGGVTANGTITKLSSGGELCIYHLAPTNLIVDLIGYTRDADHYRPVTPTRALDTRNGWRRRCDWVVRQTVTDPFELLAHDIVDGTTITLDVPAGVLPLDVPATVDADCDRVLAFRSDPSRGRPTVYELGFDGSVARTPVTSVATWVHGDLVQTTDGELLLAAPTGLFRLPAGELVDEPVWPPSGGLAGGTPTVTEIAMSRDAEVFAVARFDPGTERSSFEVVTRDGTVMSNTELEGRVTNLDISPDGIYTVVTTLQGTGTVSAVYTPFGDVVDAASIESSTLTPVFLGNGELALCATGFGLYRWQLFGPIERLTPPDDPFLRETRDGGCGTLNQ